MYTVLKKSWVATWRAEFEELKAENLNLKEENAKMKLENEKMKEELAKNSELQSEIEKLKGENGRLEKSLTRKKLMLKEGRKINEKNVTTAQKMASLLQTKITELNTKIEEEVEKTKKAKKKYTLLEMHLYEYVQCMLKREKKKRDEKAEAKKQISCEICTQPYSNTLNGRTPRVLGCGHTMCLDCAKRVTTNDSISCCFCRRITCIPGFGAPALAKNYLLLEMMVDNNAPNQNA